MSIDFNPFKNPWDVGGEHHNDLPWVQQAKEFGWDTGNDYFQPKTREEIEDERILQLAILAVILVAPLLAGSAGGGTATSGQAAGVTAGQAALGHGAGAGIWPSALAGATAKTALKPYLPENGGQQVASKAREGIEGLDEYFQQIAPTKLPHQEFEWQPKILHPAMTLLENVFGEIEKDIQIRRRVEHAINNGNGSIIKDLVAASLPTSNIWANHPGHFPVGKPLEPSFHYDIQGQGPATKVSQLCIDDPKYASSLTKGSLFDYDESSDEIAFMHYTNAPTEEEKLNIIEQYYQDLIPIGRDKLGWSIAAKHLDYFLNGTPGPDGKLLDMIVDPQYLFQFKRVRDSMARTVSHIFHGNLMGDQNPGLLHYASILADGGSKVINDNWESLVDYPGRPTILGEIPDPEFWDGLSYSMGGFTLDATHSTTLTRIDRNTVNFEGEITYRVEDMYDWHIGLSVGNGTGSIAIDDQWAQKLIDGGRANTFLMRSTIKVKFHGEIINGKFYVPVFEKNCTNP